MIQPEPLLRIALDKGILKYADYYVDDSGKTKQNDPG
jgi:hypothetical protein